MQPLTRRKLHFKFINISFFLGAGNVFIGRISVEFAGFAIVKSSTSPLKRKGKDGIQLWTVCTLFLLVFPGYAIPALLLELESLRNKAKCRSKRYLNSSRTVFHLSPK